MGIPTIERLRFQGEKCQIHRDQTYDWRGYTSKTGKYSGKNHGNAWRIKPNAKAELFGEIEKVEL